MDRLAQRLLKSLERSARELDVCVLTHKEKTKTDTGELLLEYSEKQPGVKGLVDRGGLKQLTAVMKDLQDILWADPDLDARERLLKLEKLKADVDAKSTETAVTVVLDGGVEDYAG